VPQKQLQQIKAGDTLDLTPFHIQVLPAMHVELPGFSSKKLSPELNPPLSARDYRMDVNFSFHITVDGIQIMTDPGQEYEEALSADLLLIQPHVNIAKRDGLLEKVQPRVVIPVHWDDHLRPLTKPLRPFFQWPIWSFPPIKRIDLVAFRKTIADREPRIKVLLPEIFQAYDLDALVRGSLKTLKRPVYSR
jgi:L-ascorbate metabolism protein UlaG (beta-lactamase superfamily)